MKLILGLCTILALLVIKVTFNVSITQTRDEVVATQEVEKARAATMKRGELTTGQCYMLAKDPGDWDMRRLIDTFGFPKDSDSVNASSVHYPLKGKDWESCDISFDYKDKLERVSMDLYLDF